MQKPLPEIESIPIAKHTATILLVDDEPAVRMVVSEILRRQGYRVVCCETGQSAIEIYQEQRNEIDLVLFDLTLPDVLGDQLLLDLRRICPGVRMVASSGYPTTPNLAALLLSVDGYLQKPFDPAVLEKTVTAALARPA